jgi:high affinity cAMP-specific and IBMX-insensitive 3',5'-cyclic phosphodiesterase 8
MQDSLTFHVRAAPVACLGKSTTHIVLMLSSTQVNSHEMGLPSIPQAKEPRGSLHSIRRGSFDIRSIASDGLRRTSLAKLSSLPLEAPITKVLSILAQVQENCSADEAKLLDRVIEFLKREGLYSPQIKEIRPEDPTATDLIGALLTVSRRKSIYHTACLSNQISTHSRDRPTMFHRDAARMNQSSALGAVSRAQVRPS